MEEISLFCKEGGHMELNYPKQFKTEILVTLFLKIQVFKIVVHSMYFETELFSLQ